MGIKLIGLLLGCLLLIGCTAKGLDKEFTLEQISLGTNYSISSNFFLGCGSINGDSEFYYYFYTNDNGTINLRKVFYNNVNIHYTKDKPKASFSASGCSGGTDLSNYKNDIKRASSYSCGYTWDIYIPEGSIVNNYDVNIK